MKAEIISNAIAVSIFTNSCYNGKRNNIEYLSFMNGKRIVALLAIILAVAGGGYFYRREVLGNRLSAVQRAGSDPAVLSQAAGTPKITTQVLSEIRHGDRSKKQVIFTFDGGAGIQSADAILAILAKHHVKGTFFLTGKMVLGHPDLVRRIAAAGHEIFNHTYDHKDLTKLTDAEIKRELLDMDSALEKTVGSSTRPYFRTPYSAVNAKVLSAAGAIGYRSVEYTLDALDWREGQGETAAQVQKRVLSHVAPGVIYLMHLGDNITGEILDKLFSDIEARGYKIVSLTQGL